MTEKTKERRPLSSLAQIFQTIGTYLLILLGILGYKAIEPIIVHQVVTLKRQDDSEVTKKILEEFTERSKSSHLFTEEILDFLGKQIKEYVELFSDFNNRSETGAKYEMKRSDLYNSGSGKIEMVTITSVDKAGSVTAYVFESASSLYVYMEYILSNSGNDIFGKANSGIAQDIKDAVLRAAKADTYLPKVDLDFFRPEALDQSIADISQSPSWRDIRHLPPHVRALDTVIDDVLVNQIR
jgi:hypothetical protein